MEQIEQLKSMRDAAQERLQSNPDYKLKNSLDALIEDLEAFMAADSTGVVEQTDQVDQQEEQAASDDEEEQQVEEQFVSEQVEEPVQVEETYQEQQPVDYSAQEAVVEPVEEVLADEIPADEVDRNQDDLVEDSDLAAALAENISAEDLQSEVDANGAGMVNSTELDMEAEAAIEALEAELAQSDTEINRR